MSKIDKILIVGLGSIGLRHLKILSNLYEKADIIIVSINCDLKNNNLIKLNEFKQSIVSMLKNISEKTLIII